MNSAPDDQTANDAKWLAWVEKGKSRDIAAARKYKRVGGIAASVIAVGIAFYMGAAR